MFIEVHQRGSKLFIPLTTIRYVKKGINKTTIIIGDGIPGQSNMGVTFVSESIDVDESYEEIKALLINKPREHGINTR